MEDIVNTVYGSKEIAIGANRVRIPAQFRSFLGNKFIATVGANGCFLLMPECNKETVLKNYVKIDDPLTSDYIDLARLVNYRTTKIELDVQDRFSIDENLKKICKGLIDAESITFCGMGDYIEAWPTQVYNKKFGIEESGADEVDDLIAALKAKLRKN